MNDDVSVPLTSPTSDSSVVNAPNENKPRRFPSFALLLPVVVFALVLTASWSLVPSSTNESPPAKIKRHVQAAPWIVNTTILFPKELTAIAKQGQKVVHKRINPSRVNMQQVNFTSRTICTDLKSTVNAIVKGSATEFIFVIQPQDLDRCIGNWRFTERIYMVTPQSSLTSSAMQLIFHLITGADALRGKWEDFVERVATRLNLPKKNDEKELLESLSAVRMRTMDDSSEEEEDEKNNYIDLLADGDNSVNECQDAYRRVCGKFTTNSEHLTQRTGQLSRDYDLKMKEILVSTRSTKSQAINKLIQFYDQCMNTLSNSTKAANQFWRYVKGDLIEWPLLENSLGKGEVRGFAEYGLRDPPILNETCLANLEKCPLELKAFQVTLNETVIRFAKDLGKKVDLRRLEEEVKCTAEYHAYAYQVKKNPDVQKPECAEGHEKRFEHNNQWIERIEEDGNQVIKQKPFPPRDVCLVAAEKCIPDAFYGLYVRAGVDSKSLDAVEEIFANIRKSFLEILDNAFWIPSDSKRQMFEKINTITIWPGYDRNTLNDSLLDQHYADVLEGEQYANIFLEFHRLRHFTNYSSSTIPPLAGGIKYIDSQNIIILPAQASNMPYFSPSERRSLNYGALGLTLSHEMAHAIDPENQLLWSTPSLQQKLNCLVQQFDNVTIPEIGETLSGRHMIFETFADNAALPVAYHAFAQGNAISPREKKNFFYAAARLLCAVKPTPDDLRVQIEDPHPPALYRVNELFKSLPEYSEVFGCQRDSEMNPATKCTFWKSEGDADASDSGY